MRKQKRLRRLSHMDTELEEHQANDLCCPAELHSSVEIIILHSEGQSGFRRLQAAGELKCFSASRWSRLGQCHVNGLWPQQVDHFLSRSSHTGNSLAQKTHQ